MPFKCRLNLKLLFFYIFCSGSSLADFNLKRDPISFSKRSESLHINRRMVHKYVVTVFLLNKAISLSITKPFYDSVRQSVILLSIL